MKYLIVSDIHGSLPRLEQVLEHFTSMNMDMLIILGDILNYGPRNGVPEGLDAQGIAERLNSMNSKIIAVRGNCDSEVDQMLLHFPIMADYTLIVDNGIRIFLTHGHIYNEKAMPKLSCEALVYGHTHRWKLETVDDTVICNTGSITFPKDGNPPTFATYSNNKLCIHKIDGSIIKEIILK